jgi:hypothetical protein
MEEISVIGRNTMGRTLVRMDPEEYVVDVARAEPSEDDDKDSDELDTDESPASEMTESEDDESADEE